jgi:hypothetical protein
VFSVVAGILGGGLSVCEYGFGGIERSVYGAERDYKTIRLDSVYVKAVLTC